MILDELLQRLELGEDQDLEFKSAEGGFPKSAWETISAFANTGGGYLVLGVQERRGRVELGGVGKPEALKQDFWNGHNNPQKLSTPLCAEPDFGVVAIDGRNLVVIHADHQSSRPITVSKERDAFVFSNPGRLRIPLEALYRGGVSDPRNPTLQKMFQMLGLGEKAGSGFQKILRAWREQHWLWPFVAEDTVLDMTRITLPLASMIPEEVEEELREVVGDAYGQLTELDRVILMLAHRFGAVSNAGIQPYRREHPREIGERLKYLVSHHCLVPDGRGRGTRYQLANIAAGGLFPEMSEVGSGHYASGSGHYGDSPEQYDSVLETIAAPVREKGRAPKELVEQTIDALCKDKWLTLRTLAQLLNRDAEALRKHYITRMVREGKLEARFPGYPNHPEQAYQTKR